MNGFSSAFEEPDSGTLVSNRTATNSLGHRLGTLYIIAASVLFLAFFLQSKEQNWDMLGYAASTFDTRQASAADIHSSVYATLKEYTSPEDYERLTSEGTYESVMRNNPDAFMQQVPYYKIRVIYVGIMQLLTRFDVNIYYAGNLISAVAGALGFLVFSLLFLRYIKPAFILLAPLLLVLSGVQDAAQRVGPDSLLFLWSGLICWAFLNKHWSIYPLLIFSVWVRTDAILLVAVFLMYLLYINRQNWKAVFITGILSVAGLVGINTWAGNYGWATVFHYVFVTGMTATHPAEFSSVGINLTEYINAVKEGLKSLTYNYRFMGFLSHSIIVTIIIWSLRRPGDSVIKMISKALRDPVIALIAISIAYIAMHFLLFPAMWSRFFLGQYVIAGFAVFYSVTHILDLNQGTLSR